MDNNRDHREDIALDALFAAADDARPAPSDDLLERLMSDADNAVPRPAEQAFTSRPRGWSFPLKGFFTASGLTAAAAVGVWIGIVIPETFIPYAAEDTVELYTFLPGADLTAALSE